MPHHPAAPKVFVEEVTNGLTVHEGTPLQEIMDILRIHLGIQREHPVQQLKLFLKHHTSIIQPLKISSSDAVCPRIIKGLGPRLTSKNRVQRHDGIWIGLVKHQPPPVKSNKMDIPIVVNIN